MAKSPSGRPAPEKPIKARKCVFCSKKGQDIDYKDTSCCVPYISERGQSVPPGHRHCVQHQRDVAIRSRTPRGGVAAFTSSSR